MTVQELRTELLAADPEAEVYYPDSDLGPVGVVAVLKLDTNISGKHVQGVVLQ